jgi:O-acetyl-ADP-ribose deacetylase (regulator of RNase III)
MIHYVTGNLLAASDEALINTVNTVGVMGKGIALQFKDRYPYNFQVYQQAQYQVHPVPFLSRNIRYTY